MRIDFNSRFKDVLPVVKATAEKVVPATGNFRNLLSEISPQQTQPVKITEISEPKGSLNLNPVKAQAAQFAQYKFSSPQTQTPNINNPLEPTDVPNQKKDEVQGVKTPTVLELRRLNDSGSTDSSSKKLDLKDVKQMISELGAKYGVDPALSIAVASAESSFNPTAVSSDGLKSKGLFQLLDSTGLDLRKRLGVQESYSPFDPKQNAELGVGYLRHLHEIFSKPTEVSEKNISFVAANSASLEKLAVAAFNAGEGRVVSAQARADRDGFDSSRFEEIESYLPKSTQEYVARVVAMKNRFGSEDPESDLG